MEHIYACIDGVRLDLTIFTFSLIFLNYVNLSLVSCVKFVKENYCKYKETFEKTFPLEEESLLKNGDRQNKNGDNSSQDATKKQMVPFSKLVSRLAWWDY